MNGERLSGAGSKRGGAAQRLLQDVDRLRRAQPAEAWRAMQEGFRDAVSGAGPPERGELWRLRGHVLRGLRRTRAAVDAYRRAERWFARAGDGRERGRCAIGLVDSLMYLGRYREAQRAASRGRRLLQSAGDQAALARLMNNQGNLYHRLDRPERALASYRASRRALVRSGDDRGATLVDGNIANCLSLLGRCDEARRLYVRARRTHVRAGFPLDALRAEYNLAYLDFLEHRQEQALDGLGRVRQAAQDRGAPSLSALSALDRSEILLRLGVHDDARAEALRASRECDELSLGYERAKAETFAALAEFRLGRPDGARRRLEHVLGLFAAEGNSVWLGEALVGLATIWWHEGNARAAVPLLAAAGRCFSRAADREREGCALALLARARLQSGDQTRARAALARARRLARRRGSARLRHVVGAASAELARARGDWAGARRQLRRAAGEAERLAARILDGQWRASFWGDWGWPHQELAALELAAGRVAPAFEALERGRGRALVGPTTRRRRGTPGLSKVVRAWAASRLAIDRDRTTRSASNQVVQATELPGSHDHPSSLRRALAWAPLATFRASDVQRGLPRETLLLDYTLHRGALGVFAMTHEHLSAASGLVSERELQRLCHAVLFTLRGAAQRSPRDRGPDPELAGTLSELASLVLWPALRLANGDGHPRSIAVVPAGPMARLPWAALPLPDGRRLCEAAEVTVVPGLRLGMAMRRHGLSHRQRPGLGVGPAASGRPLVVAADVGELQGVDLETDSIQRIFPEAERLSGARATAREFLSRATKAPWIHFAGHGLFRVDAPDQGGLRLADRWILADELEGLRLSARWVTLSACQTARALVRPGEEWFGLARTFLTCGAQAVVASQWDIEDGPAASLMSDVYARLGAGASLAEGLASVQAQLARAEVHPLEWAGFALLGGPQHDHGKVVHERRMRNQSPTRSRSDSIFAPVR